ncbi:hypothetical protein J2S09_004082 [Bacillus fengqiuensis]|nr:hypothetical protein [Bacillus fengqiuensis]
MNCTNCQTTLMENSMFCHVCGTEVQYSEQELIMIQNHFIKKQVREQRSRLREMLYSKEIRTNEELFEIESKKLMETLKGFLNFCEENFEMLFRSYLNEINVAQELKKHGLEFDEEGNWFNKKQVDILNQVSQNEEIYNLYKNSYMLENNGTLRREGKKKYNNVIDFIKNEPDDVVKKMIYGYENANKVDLSLSTDWDILDIADAALAFMSPVSAARYMIQKLKD